MTRDKFHFLTRFTGLAKSKMRNNVRNAWKTLNDLLISGVWALIFFQPSTKLFEILAKIPVLFWSVGMIKQLSSSMLLKKGNSNRFLSYMDGRFRQQLTIIDVSMSVALLIISTYFQKTLFQQRWCLQVFGLCDRITWKQINWKTKND